MISSRSQIIEFIEQGAIPAKKVEDALLATKVRPDNKSWRDFVDHLLLWLGGLALASAVMFFIAYNWNIIGRFAKFGIIEGLIVLTIAVHCMFGEHTTPSKSSIFVATIFLGILLAFYGQTYQTGADTWQLFFTWALLMLPWAIMSRFPALWIFWVVLMNVSIILYYQSFLGRFLEYFLADSGLLWTVFCFNTIAFIIWEFTAKTIFSLPERWAIRLLAIFSGMPITWLVLNSIFDHREVDVLPGLVWAAWVALMYVVYRKKISDLFMLAACCMSVIAISTAFISKYLLGSYHFSAVNFLLIALVVIAMGGGAAFWLKSVHQEFQS